jgi:hypothetical protein
MAGKDVCRRFYFCGCAAEQASLGQTDKTMMMPSNLSLSLFPLFLFLFSVILISGLIVFFSLLRSADSSLPLSQEKKMESELKIKPIKILKP